MKGRKVAVKRKKPSKSDRDVPPSPSATPRWLTVVGATHNNLKNIDVSVPLGRFVGVTGVSGSGKSSLVNDVLREALVRDLNGATNVSPGLHQRIDGKEHLDKIIDIDQSPIGRTPRSNPATYIKVFDEIRDLFARLPDAKVRGYKPGRFSFNVTIGQAGGGRCEACEGHGANKMEMELLADVWVTCPICGGRRFSRETLQILYKGKSIADVLDMDVQQALDHFANIPAIASMLRTLHDVGLDYLKLGQSSTTLSGGEAQRIKLAKELVRRSTGRTLYVLDEPTTGLHFADIKRLLAVLHGFVDAGNTVVVIEHNLDVIKTADWIIDLGPEGGDHGGRVVVEGTPEEVIRCSGSYTGAALRDVLTETPKRRNAEKEGTKARGHGGTKEERRDVISVVGARQHNLKNIDVDFPRERMTVCCGPSGSGKSSFAVDTVYTEGQRRYVESLSSYARQFLGRLQPPKVDHVYGLSPAICIEQKNTSRSPRSTVGTVTEIQDYMRVLWARVGKPYCPKCKTPIAALAADEIVSRLLDADEGTKFLILAPVERSAKEDFAALLQRERTNGYSRVRINGKVHELDDAALLKPKSSHRVEIVVDRVTAKKSQASRLTDSVEQALTVGQGVMFAQQVGDDGEPVAGAEMRFSKHRSCSRCATNYEELTPHNFSFNTRLGWCESCEGLGIQQGADPAAIVVGPTRSIVDGAIAGWGSPPAESKLFALASALAEHLGVDVHLPWNQWPASRQLAFLQGTGEEWIATGDNAKALPKGLRFQWRGFFPTITRATLSSAAYRDRLADMVTDVPCQACGGSRLRADAAAVRVAGKTMHDIGIEPLGKALDWFKTLRIDAREKKIAGELLHEIASRLGFLVEVGLDYLTLHRTAATLSGGEAQRIQLASQIGTGLTGVLYVLDEPTIGLHPRDNARLIGALHRLRNLGNTLLLVEHDREVIAAADHILDFGPGAGDFGGRVTAAASPDKLTAKQASLTGKYLSGRQAIPVPSNRRPVAPPPRLDLEPVRDDEPRKARSQRPGRREKRNEIDRWLTVVGARQHNLKEVDAAFPLGRFICVTGVSGSGKSTLVGDVLHNALAVRLHRASLAVGGHQRIIGLEHVDKVINVDQSPIGNSPTSNAATYTGVFDVIRELFAALPLSKMRGYTANRYSFNRPGGRCEPCEGMGQRRIEMHFLPDVWIECENCGGRRFTAETLEVQYKGKSIADVLSMRVSEAVALFETIPRVRRMLQTLDDVGLGYLQLGQAAPTLSGGEAQRVKLAAELGRPSTGKTLYLLDEPTTGLHFDDLKKLVGVLHRLVDLGNTVLCIEHNLDVIKTADWVIDLGPEAGEAGGRIVAEGSPEAIVACTDSLTGVALRPILAQGPVEKRPVFDPSRQAEIESTLQAPIRLDHEVKMPWETDGKAWHTLDHRDLKGTPVKWDANVLTWLVETVESLDENLETDWGHRTRVEIKTPRAAQWFLHALTGFTELLEVAIRVPEGTVPEADLQEFLKIKPLDARQELPIYGQWDRVRIRRMTTGWDDIRVSLRDFEDVKKPAFAAFLRKAAAEYKRKTQEVAARPEQSEPWTLDGQQWHLSQKSMSRRQVPKWKPLQLMTLIGRFKSMQPNLILDWNSKTAVLLRVPGQTLYRGKIVTNMGKGLRVELRAPKNEITPAQVDRLAEEVEIRRGIFRAGSGSDPVDSRDNQFDWIIFWVEPNQTPDPDQLRDTWRRCGETAEERLQSA